MDQNKAGADEHDEHDEHDEVTTGNQYLTKLLRFPTVRTGNVQLLARSGGLRIFADNRKSDFWGLFRVLSVFNKGDEFFELQECQSGILLN